MGGVKLERGVKDDAYQGFNIQIEKGSALG